MFHPFLAISCKIILLFISVILLVGNCYVDTFFGELSIEQIIFHLQYYSNENYYLAVLQSGCSRIFFAIVSVFAVCLVILCYKDMLFCITVFIISASIFTYKFKLVEFFSARFVFTDFYEENYINPKKEAYFFPKEKKNIILIFWESVEKTYDDENIFGHSLLGEMRHFQQKEMGHYKQIFGSQWTIAGMVTTMCSIPLRTLISENVYGQKSFLPGAYCLPQVLKKRGYRNIWLSTSSAEFAFMDNFFHGHGFRAEDIYDTQYFAKKYGKNYKEHILGGDDTFMFAELKRFITDFREDQQPFFLVVNTINTHMGLKLPDYCKKKFGDFRDQIVCSSEQMADFLMWFEKQKNAQNTVVLIIGDHLAMEAKANQMMAGYNDKREIFNLFFAGKGIVFDKNRQFSGLDIMPTLLDALGVQWGSRRLGLGVSLLSAEENLLEKIGLEKLNHELMRYSTIYDAFLFEDNLSD